LVTDYRQTLGLALYRACRIAEAATVAESNSRVDRMGIDWLVPAMSRQRLGQAAEARAALAEAVHWRSAQTNFWPHRAAVFDRLLREAESLVAKALPDLPTDVFARREPFSRRGQCPALSNEVTAVNGDRWSHPLPVRMWLVVLG
jgi:hypothetical protein